MVSIGERIVRECQHLADPTSIVENYCTLANDLDGARGLSAAQFGTEAGPGVASNSAVPVTPLNVSDHRFKDRGEVTVGKPPKTEHVLDTRVEQLV